MSRDLQRPVRARLGGFATRATRALIARGATPGGATFISQGF